jgi:hypothetical protein
MSLTPTTFFIAHILPLPPDISDDFDEIDIRANFEEEDIHSEIT